MDDDAQLRLLPPRTRGLARTIGLDALLLLSRWRGGITIYVPSKERLGRNHPIARAIGHEAAVKLAEEKGRRVEIPIMNNGASALLHTQIRKYRDTHSESETARHFRITDRWVRNLMATQEPEAGPQTDMFGGH